MARGFRSILIFSLFFGLFFACITPGTFDTRNAIYGNDGPNCFEVSFVNGNTRGSLTTFKDGSSEKDVCFAQAGFNDTVEINLPTRINITAASMVVEGKPLGGEVTKEMSFNDTVNSSAWWGGTGSAPVGPPSDYKDNAYLIASYVALKNRDDIRLRTQNVVGQYAYQQFSFHMPMNDVTSFEVLYEGGGMAVPEMGFATSGIKLYIYHVSGSRWDQVDLFTSGEVWDERTLGGVYQANPVNYVDVSGNVHLVATTYVGGTGFTAWVDTDFIHLMVTGCNPDAYPTDSTLNVDARGSNEWEHQGELTGQVTINDTHGFRASLQEILDEYRSGDTLNISLSLYSANPSMIGLKELMIEYDMIPQNRPPSEIDDINGSLYSFPEDTDEGIGLIDLYEFFDDDGGQDRLIFSMTMNHEDLTASINTTTQSLDLFSVENFFGTEEFRIRVTDGEGLHIDSDVFPVSVTPTNDPPYITEFEGESLNGKEYIELTVLEDEVSIFNFSTWDIDGDIPQFGLVFPFPDPDVILLRVSNENASCGTIIVEPRNEDVGLINFSLVIDDVNRSSGSSLKTQYNVSMEVINTNDAPIIDEVDRKTGKEDEWLNITLTAGDPDLDNDGNEKLTYHTNFSDSGIDDERWDLDGETGNFSFLPDNSQVGRIHVNFSVKDNYGKEDWTRAVFEVENVNDPPLVKKIDHHIVDADKSTMEKENLTVNFFSEPAEDPDLIHGDALSYLWDFDASDGVDNDAMGMNVGWTYERAGNYTVTLTVQDSGIPMAENSTSITIEVFAPPVDTGADEKKPGEDENDDDNKGGGRTEGKGGEGMVIILVIGIVLVVIFIIGAIAILIRRKKKKENEPDNSYLPPSPQSPQQVTYVTSMDVSPSSSSPPLYPPSTPLRKGPTSETPHYAGTPQIQGHGANDSDHTPGQQEPASVDFPNLPPLAPPPG